MKKTIYTLSLIVFTIFSCSKKNSVSPYKLDNTAVSVHYDQTHQFQVSQGSAALQGSATTWKTSDTTVGVINQAGFFSAKRVGTVTVTGTASTYNLKATVTVVPYSTLCKEPFFQDGASIDSTEKREFRPLTGASATGLVYTGENAKVRTVEYGFVDDKMTAAVLLLANTDAVVTEADKFFSERYTLLGTANNVYYFTDKVKLIALSIDSNATVGFNALYVKASSASTSAINSKNLIELNKIRVNTLKSQSLLISPKK
jgi:hypothetical protein